MCKERNNTLIIDSREPSSVKNIITGAFESVGFNTKIEELKEGDFKYHNIIFERKEINDFVSSILEGRLKTQKRKLLKKANEGYHIYLLIQGDYKDIDSYHNINKRSFAGAIASLNEYGIHTLHCSQYDLTMMFELMYGIIRKYNEEKKIETVFIEPDSISWSSKSLMCIDGIGKETAENIIKEIPHLHIFYDNKKEHMFKALLDVQGVGLKTATKILDTIYYDKLDTSQ